MHERINIPQEEIIPNISDPIEAEEFIESLWEKGMRPTVTVPREFASCLSEGLKPHSTWIPGVEVIAATFGRNPYLPNNEDRVILDIDIPCSRIHPRFTGPDKAFHGVVILEGPIPPEQITVH